VTIDPSALAEQPAPEAPSEDQPAPEAPAAPEPSPLENRIAELEAKYATAIARATDAENASRRYQAGAEKRAAELRKELDRLYEEVDSVAAQSLSDEQIANRKLQRKVERMETRPSDNASPEDPNAVTEFRSWLAPIIQARGINAEDPEFVRSFQQHLGSGSTPAEWRGAAGLAIADMKEAQAKKVREEQQDAIKRAREEERARITQSTRAAEGRVDRGAPVARTTKNPLTMSEEEWREYEKSRDAEVGRQPGTYARS